eukprot:350255-Chlamydomonas_euryale.AAC.18
MSISPQHPHNGVPQITLRCTAADIPTCRGRSSGATAARPRLPDRAGCVSTTVRYTELCSWVLQLGAEGSGVVHLGQADTGEGHRYRPRTASNGTIPSYLPAKSFPQAGLLHSATPALQASMPNRRCITSDEIAISSMAWGRFCGGRSMRRANASGLPAPRDWLCKPQYAAWLNVELDWLLIVVLILELRQQAIVWSVKNGIDSLTSAP